MLSTMASLWRESPSRKVVLRFMLSRVSPEKIYPKSKVLYSEPNSYLKAIISRSEKSFSLRM